MSEFGRWRDREAEAFESWWKWWLDRFGSYTFGEINYHKYPEGHRQWTARDDDEIQIARLAAKEAWFKALCTRKLPPP